MTSGGTVNVARRTAAQSGYPSATNAPHFHPRCAHTHDRTERPTKLRPAIAWLRRPPPVPCTGESASSSGWRTRRPLASANEPRLSWLHLTRVEPCGDAPGLRVHSRDDRSPERRQPQAAGIHSPNHLVGSIGDIWGPRETKPPATNLFLSTIEAEGHHR
jgi:hypothetical protein